MEAQTTKGTKHIVRLGHSMRSAMVFTITIVQERPGSQWIVTEILDPFDQPTTLSAMNPRKRLRSNEARAEFARERAYPVPGMGLTVAIPGDGTSLTEEVARFIIQRSTLDRS